MGRYARRPRSSGADPPRAAGPPPRELDAYARRVKQGLDRAFADRATETRTIELDAARVVLLSDQHRGSRDGADDFRRCERAYNAALASYLANGFSLYLLGDAEELWECRPDEVLPQYERTLRLEGTFHSAGRLERFWGNHDDRWRWPGEVERHLAPLHPGLRVREALKLRLTSGGAQLGLLFLVHGHQGTLDSGRLSWLSRLFVRYVWRPLQRKLDLPSTTPSRDWLLRARHDTAMFDWASEHPERPVLIAGHTHRPVFGSSGPRPKSDRDPAEIEAELEEREAAGSPPEQLAELRAELEWAVAEARRLDVPRDIEPPCYFNTGCCSFGDGDITGLEIADGEIRLVRWPDDDHRPRRKQLVAASLRDVLAAVAAPGSGTGRLDR